MNKNHSEFMSQILLKEIRGNAPQLKNIEKYLNEGANINYQSDTDGSTALMLATVAGAIDIVRFLLESGANPLIQNHYNKTASDLIIPKTPLYQYLKNNELLFATQNNDVALVKKLISDGVEINFQGPGEYCALLIAVEQSNLELVELLLTNGADMSLVRYDGQGVMELVKDSLIYTTLQNGAPLSEERKNKLIARKQIDYHEIYEQAFLKTLEVRKNKPFDLTQLGMYQCKQPASETQIIQAEQHYGHSLPARLKEIFSHYNGGRTKLHKYDTYDAHDSISHFYTLNDDKENVNNIWHVIKNWGNILGPNTLPFAEHSEGSTYFLKWEQNQSKVYLLIYGHLLENCYYDSDLDEDYGHTIPTVIELTCDSFDTFLEALYDPN